MSLARAACVALSVSVIGCFPEYEISNDPPVLPYMKRVSAFEDSFEFELNGISTSAEFSSDFDVDTFEVTVERYKDWFEEGFPLPCDGGTSACSLDPGGPYEDSMRWDPAWNAPVEDHDYSEPGCTHDAASGDYYPMTCASWFQAVAFCAWDEKRLLTESEWIFTATNRGQPDQPYPWGVAQPDCEHATIQNCGFPTEVGAAPKGASEDGVQDLTGSVFEWVWDASWDTASTHPQGAIDYAGPTVPLGEPSHTRPHYRMGGAYIHAEGDDALRNDHADKSPADGSSADAGFRCAKSR